MPSPLPRLLAAALLAGAIAAARPHGGAAGKDSKPDLQKALRDQDIVGDWTYDDIDAGFARAAKEKRPVCIVFR